MTQLCKHSYVNGRVQGVFFRASTRDKALALGLTGWVKNLDEGSVEVMVCGDAENVAAMQAWLEKGPTAAEVKEVISDELPFQQFNQFEVLS